MEKQEAIDLLERYRAGTCTPQERLLVQQVYLEHASEALPADQPIDIEALKDSMYQVLQEKDARLRKPTIKKINTKTTFRVAAAILFGLFAVGGAAYWTKYKNPSIFGPAPITQADIPPGGNRAILTLANGEHVTLDDANTGDITQQPGAQIKKTAGSIMYTASGKAEAASNQSNQIYTPKGGQYKLVLEDGTKVWLNAGSTLTYPVSFNGREARQVTLTGEAYFQVAKDPARPFTVESNQQLITVLGTHFNVSAYPKETLKTTLEEGRIAVAQRTSGQKKVLNPGQQSTIVNDQILVKQVDPADFTAWKDDNFVFVQTPLKEVLTAIGRWYNIDIAIPKIPAENYDGKISRKIPLSQVLHALEITTDLKFKVNGRRLMLEQ